MSKDSLNLNYYELKNYIKEEITKNEEYKENYIRYIDISKLKILKWH